MNYNLVIFDLDNTLLDFDQMELGSLRQSFDQHKIEISKAVIDQYIAINKALWQGLESGLYSKSEILVLRFKQLFEALKIKKDPVLVNQDYLNNMANHIYLMEHAEALLQHLKDKVEMVIITNGVQSAQISKMARSGLNAYFSHVIISDAVGFHKPNVKIFEYLEGKMGKIDKAKTIIIGDSLSSDIQGGINYGIDTCWFNPKSGQKPLGTKMNYEIKSLKELYNIL